MRATKVDVHREVMNAIPSGTSILPSIPERKKSGTKLTIIIRVELLICMVPELAQKDYLRLNSYIYKLVLQIYWSRGIPQKQSER